jgi:hypothetical protein
VMAIAAGRPGFATRLGRLELQATTHAAVGTLRTGQGAGPRSRLAATGHRQLFWQDRYYFCQGNGNSEITATAAGATASATLGRA